ncbi:hypothetical protein [Cupriavidus sp. HPC(L)]|uniref:hypothetical protein n=1 Tax=Cupriavidus sp. HPC(L) TaxID=1217418 RepID=UPI0002E09129|nr:hypothetical protein [Cupriavidus sp. HPC(L)]
MSKAELDQVVKASAALIDEQDVKLAALEVESQIEGRAWNMNQPLNMIAYEDQV